MSHERDHMSSDKLAQSWNGFSNMENKESSMNFIRIVKDEEMNEPDDDIAKTFHFDPKNPALQNNNLFPTHTFNEKKKIKMPKVFPAVEMSEIIASKELTEEGNKLEKNLTMDDMERVLSPRKNKKSGMSHNKDKLPKINITRDDKGTKRAHSSSPQAPSHAFNCARMLTELDEVCSLQSTRLAHKEEFEPAVNMDNLLRLKIVQEAKRHSVFTPRKRTESLEHSRCNSLPDLGFRASPKRYFVKLDPQRAIAKQVNLNGWNETSQRFRVLLENLRKQDKQNIELTKYEKNVLVGRWIEETCHTKLDGSFTEAT